MGSPQLPKPPIQQAAQQSKPTGEISFMAYYEADSPECQLTEKFVEALMFRDGTAAADALRKLKELDGEALECLARLLEDSHAVDPLFPCRLELRYRRRGKPNHQPEGGNLPTPEEKLMDALMRGNRAKAGVAMRDMKRLSGAALDFVVQLLEDSPELSSFPYRLVFVYRQRGRPRHPLRAKSFGRYLAVEHAKADFVKADVLEGKKLPRMKSAVGKARDQTNCSRPTLYRAVKRYRPKPVNL
jgi:hypothetical protein